MTTIFQRMSIIHKLTAVAGILLVGFAGVGITYFRLEQVHEEVAQRTEALHVFITSTTRAGAKTLESELLLKDFFSQNTPSLMSQFTATISEAHMAATVLERLALTAPTRAQSLKLTEAVSAFQRAAQETIGHTLAIGLDAESGLRGTVRQAATAVEQALPTLGAPVSGQRQEATALHELWVTVQQYESEFMLQGKAIQAGNLSAAKKTLSDAVQAGHATEAEKTQLVHRLDAYHEAFLRLAERVKQRERSLAKLHQQQRFAAPLVSSLGSMTLQAMEENRQHGSIRITQIHRVFGVALVSVAVLLILSLGLVGSSLRRRLRYLQHIVSRVIAGDREVRTKMRGRDELATLGEAFDSLLDGRALYEAERAARLAEAERENEALNDAVTGLLYAVHQLCERDLTVQIPMTEDATGPVADALNQLAEEMAGVLTTVVHIAGRVATTSQEVQVQGDTVRALAEAEREQVTQTATQLAAAATAMQQIAALAQDCDVAAEDAIGQTQTALTAVSNTVDGIHSIRDTIRETEQRIKLLGERSHEVGTAVSLITSIAERTHILALNASMHAATAGEAGRGFAVVANEVQRLAETAQQATEQITHLVHNIQTEMSDTATTMAMVISQVVDGSRLAGEAGEQMRQTQQSTAALVSAVHKIAAGAQAQAQVSTTLCHYTDEIVESTRQTNEQLVAQGRRTIRLVDDAGRLVRAVQVFKLPMTQQGGALIDLHGGHEGEAEEDPDLILQATASA